MIQRTTEVRHNISKIVFISNMINGNCEHLWVLHISGATYRFQLFPRALNVLLCLAPIMEVLSEEKKIRNIITLFTSLRDLKVGDLDIAGIIN